jgi:hypothetical protein
MKLCLATAPSPNKERGHALWGAELVSHHSQQVNPQPPHINVHLSGRKGVKYRSNMSWPSVNHGQMVRDWYGQHPCL